LDFNDVTFASLLVDRGASVDAIDTTSIVKESLLHKCARHYYQQAGSYLIRKNAQINHINKNGETALHLTSQFGLEKFSMSLMENGANPNIQTYSALSTIDEDEFLVGLQTSIHRAAYASQESILEMYIRFREKIVDVNLKPNFNIQDEHGQSVFSLTLWMNMLPLAKQLLQIHHAELNIKDNEQTPLLAQAISKQNVEAALFLLDQGVDVNELTHGLTPIQLAVKQHLPSVVEALCRNGANMNVTDENDCSLLWNALESGQEDTASTLKSSRYFLRMIKRENNLAKKKYVMYNNPDHILQVDYVNQSFSIVLIDLHMFKHTYICIHS
jgi:rabankyrin-5